MYIAGEKWVLYQYAVCITQNSYVTKKQAMNDYK